MDVDIARVGSFWHVSVDEGRLGVEVMDGDPTLVPFFLSLGRDQIFERRYVFLGRQLSSNIEQASGDIQGSPSRTCFDRWLESRKRFSTDRVPIRQA